MTRRDTPSHAAHVRETDIMPLTVRLAHVDDAPALSAFCARVFNETFGPDNTPSDMAAYLAGAFTDAKQRAELSDVNVVCFVVHAGHELVACAMLHVGSSDPVVHGPAPVEIRRFYVDSTMHGRGLAHTLMDACVREALVRGGRTLWLGVWEKNTRAIRFYEKMGFADVGSQIFQLGNDAQTDRVMQRAIGHTDS